jgi:predicted DNA-binding transcriptional regulator AlpA
MREEISPWLTMDDMMARYHVKTTHTILAMERRGEIPKRAKTGLWLRSEVNDWTTSKMAA